MQELATAVIAHHLRLFGVEDPGIGSSGAAGRLTLFHQPSAVDFPAARARIDHGGIVLAVLPDDRFCEAMGIKRDPAVVFPPALLEFVSERPVAWQRLRSLHPVAAYRAGQGEVVVRRSDGAAAWIWLPLGPGGLLIAGTDIASDLVRYRQGDPARATRRQHEPMWGVAGERPMYLFDAQLEGESPHERHADWWAMALAETLASRLDRPLAPLLPDSAPGAVIVSGDDDQAYLEKYAEQLRVLGKTPVTYFLHPLTRHTPGTLKTMLRKSCADLGVHPDALDAPARYGELLREQAAWFKRLTGRAAVSLRNHGFLSDGYWNHLPHWLEAGVRISSNLPGLDGRVLNGSLLPARLAYEDRLTSHWSLLTAIGDGVRYIQGMSDPASADCVCQLADRIRQSALPGVMVLNLHPQNIDDTRMMHRAAMEVIKSGFHPWTMAECLAWFERRDARAAPEMQSRREASMVGQIWGRVRSRFL